MKRIVVFLTTILLSLGAFAQSGTTLKGDVNGDGKVDVEDVTSVVNIILSGKTYGYFYFGTTEPTAENFTSLPGAVASYTSIGEAVGATVSIADGETLYMLCPAAWMKGKHVDVEDGEGNSYDFVEDTDAGSISGYVIYKTQAFNEATDVILKFNNGSAETYYWYVGATNPSLISSTVTDVTKEGWREIGTSLDGWSFEVDNTNKIKFNDYPTAHAYYIVIPETLHLYFADNTIAENVTFAPVETTIPGYKAWQLSDGESATAKGFIIKE
ncbi:MAG: hypothetical protein IKQ58_07815 [Prevotella sp.]|nr:hypothetical protein [Prevotella sp.]